MRDAKKNSLIKKKKSHDFILLCFYTALIRHSRLLPLWLAAIALDHLVPCPLLSEPATYPSLYPVDQRWLLSSGLFELLFQMMGDCSICSIW
mgnify:CR=1 FL=1